VPDQNKNQIVKRLNRMKYYGPVKDKVTEVDCCMYEVVSCHVLSIELAGAGARIARYLSTHSSHGDIALTRYAWGDARPHQLAVTVRE
jgi:hypothetical protein